MTDKSIGPLRRRFIEDMTVRGFTPATQRGYLRTVADFGLTAVLHTWGSALTHHPHVHGIVPGGGISSDSRHWLSC